MLAIATFSQCAWVAIKTRAREHAILLDLDGHMNRTITINHSLLYQTLRQMKRTIMRHIPLDGNNKKRRPQLTR